MKTRKRFFSLLLAACLLVGLLPTSAMAAEEGGFTYTDTSDTIAGTTRTYTGGSGTKIEYSNNTTISSIVFEVEDTLTVSNSISVTGSYGPSMEFSSGRIEVGGDITSIVPITILGGHVTTASIKSTGLNVTNASSGVSITGGIVEVTGEISSSSHNQTGATSEVTIDGDTVVFAGSIKNNSADVTPTKGVVFVGNTGTVYGSVSLPGDIEIPEGYTLTVPSGTTLTIPEGTTLTNNGTISIQGALINNGTLLNYGTISGTITGTQPTDGRYTINFAEETITITEGCEVYTAETGGTQIQSGDSITSYIGRSLYIQKADQGSSDRTAISIPTRPQAPTVIATIDYTNEKISFPPSVTVSNLEYAFSNTASDWKAVPSGAALSGMEWDGTGAKYYYFRTKASNSSFASSSTTSYVEAKARPSAPSFSPTVIKAEDTITISNIVSDQEYRIYPSNSNASEWETLSATDGSYTWENLQPGTQYTIETRTKADKYIYYQFASFPASITVTTLYIGTVTVDTNGNGTASASAASAAAGTEITLTAKPNADSHFVKWEVVSGDITITDNKFTMPAANVEIKAVFAEHTYGEWRTNQNGTHSRTCSDCGDTQTENCSGGEATCSQLAVCEFCGSQYGDYDADNHKAVSEWTQENGKHYHKCEYGCDTHLDEANCSGGEATCTAPAVCETCGNSYGSVNPDNHTGEIVWTKTATDHSSAYDCCNALVVTEEAHEWENGVCSECGYECQHTGGTATCSQLAVCEFCGSRYGNYDADNHKAANEWTQENGKHYHKCEYGCDAHLDEADCSGGEATCTALAVCETCGNAYGAINPDNHTGTVVWTKTATTHSSAYSCCNTPVVAEEAHEWQNGVCSECGYECQHTGGTATCSQLAVCDTCGEEYGEVNASNHTNLIKTEAKPATHTETGNIEYWYCDGCDKYFSDEAGTEKISLEDTVVPKLTEHTADGTGWHSDKTGHWNTCECGEKLNEAAHTFEWVIDKEATATEAGSRHEKCTVCGYEKAAVEIPATGTPSDTDTSSPQTGDNSNIALWMAALLAAGAALTGTAVYSRKRKYSR